MTTLNTLFTDVLEFSKKRNIIGGSTAEAQLVKLLEEYGELNAGIARGDVMKIKDSIGDCLVVAINIRAILGNETYPFDRFKFEPFDITQEDIKQATAIAPVEFLGRIAYALNRPQMKDAIDIIEQADWFIYTLAEIAYVWNTTLVECLSLAVEEIKYRKGYLDPITKTFIKEADVMERLAELDKKLQDAMDNGATQDEVFQLQREATDVQDLLVKIRK